ncbi:hypothetical protein DQK91_16985 [Oceanidesulfovibrio marinus]|uniref:Uncharacterized protein n=1 Tax=Oceanidesulfovibrio marinus TaxID=370038 RepID=A0A6P1ZF43_9BACT|nr:hypothetical protein DQK91_16985 [Oceanidesulfovibrio marinus]
MVMASCDYIYKYLNSRPSFTFGSMAFPRKHQQDRILESWTRPAAKTRVQTVPAAQKALDFN